jgi:hypothetical protein
MADRAESAQSPLMVLYTNLSGLAGAVGLINLFRDLIEWRGLFNGVADLWREYVTSTMALLFSWVGPLLRIELFPAFYDYLVIGILMALGVPRYALWYSRRFGRIANPGAVAPAVLSYSILFIIAIVAWPAFVLAVVWINASETHGAATWGRFLDRMYVYFTPIVFFVALLALNYILLFAGIE